MTAANWAQLLALLVLLTVSTPLLGNYLARVYADDGRSPGARLFHPIERLIYRCCGVSENAEQRWPTYAFSLLAFSFVSVLVVYGMERFQAHLPLNPDHQVAVPAALSWNTAVSFLTNTNWQNYSGESTMAHLTQMAALAVHNFVSAAAGAAVAVALIRGLVRHRAETIGNFWVDLVRTCTRVLLPFAFIGALFLVSQGAVQNFNASHSVATVEGTAQHIPGGPIASQEAIKEIGENGGGPYNANSAHPFENPNPLTNLLEIWALLAIPFAFPWAYGRMAGNQKQGHVLLATMVALWLTCAVSAMVFETNGNPRLDALGVNQTALATQGAGTSSPNAIGTSSPNAVGTSSSNAVGNMEGKEIRFGSAGCGLFAASTTNTSTGAVNCMHDSMTSLGGGVALVGIMLGEVSPGGTGSGLYGMLIFALLAVFIAGLMVGRTPEYLGKKIQAAEMKLVVLYLLAVPLAILAFSGASIVLKTALHSLANDGPHGLTEMVYAFTSASNNNGSAFGGLSGNTDWFNTTLGLCMLVGRFFLMVPVLALAGSLARKQVVPASAGTFPTTTPLFVGLLIGVVVIVVGLTYFPVLALGPIVEHLSLVGVSSAGGVG